MKQKNLALVFMLCALLALSACGNEGAAVVEGVHSDPVKYIIEKAETKVYSGGELSQTDVTEFGSDGLPVKQTTWRKNGTVDYENEETVILSYVYERDSAGRAVSGVGSYDDGTEFIRSSYEYDEAGNKIKCVENRTGTGETVTTWSYDKEGNMTGYEINRSDGSMNQKTIYGENKFTLESRFNGNLQSTTVTETKRFDGHSSVVKQTVYTGEIKDENIGSVTNYQLDEHGKVTGGQIEAGGQTYDLLVEPTADGYSVTQSDDTSKITQTFDSRNLQVKTDYYLGGELYMSNETVYVDKK